MGRQSGAHSRRFLFGVRRVLAAGSASALRSAGQIGGCAEASAGPHETWFAPEEPAGHRGPQHSGEDHPTSDRADR